MWGRKERKGTFHWHDPTPLCVILAERRVKEAQLVSPYQANSGKQPIEKYETKRAEAEYDEQIYAWVNSTAPQPSILQSSSSLSQGLEMFLYPPSHRTCRCIYPSSLLSANTFTFLVLLCNKRGGMSRDLLTLLKQTAMKSLYWGAHPNPQVSSPVHPRSRWPACCSTVQVNSVTVWVLSVSLTVLALVSELT